MSANTLGGAFEALLTCGAFFLEVTEKNAPSKSYFNWVNAKVVAEQFFSTVLSLGVQSLVVGEIKNAIAPGQSCGAGNTFPSGTTATVAYAFFRIIHTQGTGVLRLDPEESAYKQESYAAAIALVGVIAVVVTQALGKGAGRFDIAAGLLLGALTAIAKTHFDEQVMNRLIYNTAS